MKDQVIVCVLDIPIDDPNYRAYAALAPSAQVNLIKEKLKEFAVQAAKKYPKAMHVAVLREYAITGAVPNDSKTELKDVKYFTLSEAEKNYLQREMQSLLPDHPNLNIIAGSVAVTRPHAQVEKKFVASLKASTKREEALAVLKKQKEYYDVVPIECKSIETKIIGDSQRVAELAKIKEVEEELLACTTDEEAKSIIDKITYVSNSSYIFRAKSKIQESKTTESKATETKATESKATVVHNSMLTLRKTAAFKESGGSEHPYRLFRPASRRTNDGNFVLVHPSGRKIKTRLRICLDSILLDLGDKVKSQPELEFVISHPIKLRPDRLEKSGINLIHADSVVVPHLIKTGESDIDVKLFTYNILDNTAKITGPLKPFIPIEQIILEKLKIAMVMFEKAIATIENIFEIYKVQKSKQDPLADEKLKTNLAAHLGINLVYDSFVSYVISNKFQQPLDLCLEYLDKEFQLIENLNHQILTIDPSEEFKNNAHELPDEIYKEIKSLAEDKNSICQQIFTKDLKEALDKFKKDPDKQYLNTATRAPLDKTSCLVM